ncbi:phage portal protein [Rhodococcus rhodochrous]|uniref:phage portal protein n=1 Tax=Rhodococcus rhodochrous TaxID=1829 RepID=UPI001E328E6D|nr:phage portal protein [Rhodococcus rhodochrous]MCD2096545.1 phage portal protein [Rhodococcus rhodochrous]MCD2121237.1 phage portal protein [Rhodococcus rhodochrous]MCQ4137331.1 phage portal protein [Rhodococcus rhodochrous]MDJ0021176.1 phage portal protein [Rhodococcus rhodochrous]
MTAPALIRSSLLSGDEAELTRYLFDRLGKFRGENELKESYYTGTQFVKQLGIAIPPQMQNVRTVSGWAGTTVDVLEERLDWQGWIETDVDLGLSEIYRANDLDVDSGPGHLDALVYGIAFAVVGSGAAGEPSPLVTVESPKDVTGLYSPRTRLLSSALKQWVDEDGRVMAATLYLPDETVHVERKTDGGAWHVVDRDEHRLGRVPVARIVNRPRAGAIGGRSEITEAVRYYTDNAVRTMLAMEVNREFYTSPQRYVLGADEDAFVDQAGNPVPGWQTIMGRVLGLGRDEEGNVPEVGQFPQSTQGPYVESVRLMAQQLAAEAGIPSTYLGIATDQASSADAIKALEARLVKRAERRQVLFGKAWLEVARLCLLVRDGEVPAEFSSVSTKWRDASTPTRSAAADEALKYASAGIVPPESTVLLDRAGFSPTEQRQIAADRRRLNTQLVMQNLANAAANVDSEAQQLAARRVDADTE